MGECARTQSVQWVLIVYFSVLCSRDSQVAQDTNRLSGSAYTGAATYALIQAIERGGVQQSYAQLLSSMHYALQHATGGSSAPGLGDMALAVVLGLFGGVVMSSGQTPVLSCDKQVGAGIRPVLPLPHVLRGCCCCMLCAGLRLI